jgi:subtilisin family serine protease
VSFGPSRAAIVVLLLAACPSFAAPPSKLDARCRAAVARLSASGSSIEAMRANGLAVDDEGALSVFIRGPVRREALEAAGARVLSELPGLFTASLPISAVASVEALPGVTAIRAGARCAPELNVSVPSTGMAPLRGPGPAFAGFNGQGVLVGIIDSGVDYQHGDFRDSTGATRIVRIWDQTAIGTGPPGTLFPYGKEWTPAEIDLGTSDETDSLEHGTHAAGIAVGDGSQTGGAIPAYTYAGMAPRADIIIVKTDFITPEVIDAVKYVFDKATARGQQAVVNLSLGTQYGSHDDRSDFEQGIDALVGPGRIVVKSAGNDRGKAVHADVFATAPGASATVSVSGSGLDRFFEIDGYYNATERLRVRVMTPNGTVIGPLSINTENAPWPGLVTPNGTVYVSHDSLDTSRKNIYMQVQIEQSNKNMNGTWTITLLADQLGPANGEVDLWRFLADPNVTANFVTGNLPTQELVTEPGNASGVITVGAYVTKASWAGCNGVVTSYSGTPAAGNLAPFSSPGMTRDGRQKPDLVAPGIAIGSTTSFDVAHSCPAPPTGSELLNDGMNHRMMSGTSMSAPHVTGAVALLLQKFGAMTPAQVKSYLQTHALVDGFTGAVPSKDWGYGKLKLGDLIDPMVHVVYPNGSETRAINETIALTWSASDSLGVVEGVDLQLSRSGPAGPFENLALGITNSGSYNWNVTGPTTSSAYLRVSAHDTNANVGRDLSDAAFSIVGPVDVPDGHPPVSAFALDRPSPNPTPGQTHVDFELPRESRVRISVHDVQGRAVAVLVDGLVTAGRHRTTWEGRVSGSRAPPGLYFVCFDTPAGRLVRRLAVAR